MSNYAISVRETLKRTVIVKADDLVDAISKVEVAVENGKIILDYEDYYDREIAPSEYWNNGIVPDGEDVSYYWNLDD